MCSTAVGSLNANVAFVAPGLFQKPLHVVLCPHPYLAHVAVRSSVSSGIGNAQLNAVDRFVGRAQQA